MASHQSTQPYIFRAGCRFILQEAPGTSVSGGRQEVAPLARRLDARAETMPPISPLEAPSPDLGRPDLTAASTGPHGARRRTRASPFASVTTSPDFLTVISTVSTSPPSSVVSTVRVFPFIPVTT